MTSEVVSYHKLSSFFPSSFVQMLNYSITPTLPLTPFLPYQKLILPGVGHFSHCLTSLSAAGYLPAIHAHIAAGKSFFGICVGLQALFSGSDEAPGVPGLGIIQGQLKRFDEKRTTTSTDQLGMKSVPCIGWNSASLVHDEHESASRSNEKGSRSFYGLEDWRKYYYVHSYFAPYDPRCEMEKQGWTIATATYGGETYAGAIGRGNVFATQFHPEKSGEAGLRVIRAFLEDKEWEDVTAPEARDNLTNGVHPSTMTRTASAMDSSTNGLTRRIVACLDVRTNDDGDLVVTKGDQYDVREKTTTSSPSTATTDPSSLPPAKTQRNPAGRVRNLGKPVDLASKYYTQGADEITFLNITSFRHTPVADLPMLEILRQTSGTVFVPLTVGGGIRDTIEPSSTDGGGGGRKVSALEVAKLYFESGADKVSIGSDAVTAAEEFYARGEKLSGDTAIETISQAYGCQAVVVSVDPRRVFVDGPDSTTHHTIRTAFPEAPNNKNQTGRQWVWYQCTVSGGREGRDMDVRQLVRAVERMGAGEILLNAIDRDGSSSGFDLELIRDVKAAVGIPVIASSGAGRPEHFGQVFAETGADAALGAGIFHRGEYTVGEVKGHLEDRGMLVRRDC
jgi:imidazole glycerol-phosphate synthase